ncbi:MAG: bifunctional riboflavin kinase/FAD synthetase [Anaerolineaceae bacterium]|nr:bifunctional riboflavin kinase/FAD synthetase [Anaerolineaceae bacterium]
MPDTAMLQGWDLHDARVTIGSFDGVHRGHQLIIRRLVESAREAGAPAVVITFYPHPAVVLGKKANHYYLSHPAEREEMLKQVGVDEVITLAFSRELAALSPEEFLTPLKSHLGMKELWVGYDFALGRNRAGNTQRLSELGEEFGYELKLLDPFQQDERVISSSLIRDCLANGDMEAANNMLGRTYSLTGNVVVGDGRGRQIGFPTANLSFWEEKLVPRNGIYAGWAWVEGRRYGTAINVGLRPTFGDDLLHPRVEPFILDFDRDIYGEEIRVEFVKFLRPEARYDSIDELIAQIFKDVENTREVLANAA